jgi:hypothetical protein
MGLTTQFMSITINPYSEEDNLQTTIWEFLPGILKFLSILAIVGILFFGSQAYLLSVERQSAKETDPLISGLIRQNTPVFGNLEANIVVYIISDFQCHFCALYYPTVKQAMATYSDKVKFAFKHYPLSSNLNSPNFRLAFAAQAAHKQGFYQEFATLAYAQQDEFKKQGNAILETWAKSISGLNFEQWKVDQNSSEVRAAVVISRADVDNLALPSTVNSKKPKPAGTPVGTPTTVLFKNQEVVDWWSGANDEALTKVLAELTSSIDA